MFFCLFAFSGKNLLAARGEFDGDLYENIVLSRTSQLASEELFREPDCFVSKVNLRY